MPSSNGLQTARSLAALGVLLVIVAAFTTLAREPGADPHAAQLIGYFLGVGLLVGAVVIGARAGKNPEMRQTGSASEDDDDDAFDPRDPLDLEPDGVDPRSLDLNPFD